MKDKHEREILRLLDANGGVMTPDHLIDEAKDPDSPLHDAFEWDVEKAAMRHWRQTARQMINSVEIRVVTATKEIRVPAMVRDPDAAYKEQGYVSSVKLKEDSDRRHAAIVYEYSRAAAALDRAQRLAAFFGLEDKTAEVHASVEDLKRRAQQLMTTDQQIN